MEIVALQNDSVLKVTLEFWKHAITQKYPNLPGIGLRIVSFFVQLGHVSQHFQL